MPFEITSWSARRSTSRARAAACSGAGPGSAVPLLQNFAALGIRRGSRDTRQRKCLRVDEDAVAARMREHDRVVRRHDVERNVSRKSFNVRLRFRGPFVLMPAAPDNPLSWLCGLYRVGHHLHDLIPARRARQIEAELAFADSQEVSVSLDEAGNRELAVEIDHLRRRCDVLPYVGSRSDEDDSVPARRKRLRLRHDVVDRDNAAVLKHQIGGRGWHGSTGASAAGSGDDQEQRGGQDPPHRNQRTRFW
jgi:hypothetical protein